MLQLFNELEQNAELGVLALSGNVHYTWRKQDMGRVFRTCPGIS